MHASTTSASATGAAHVRRPSDPQQPTEREDAPARPGLCKKIAAGLALAASGPAFTALLKGPLAPPEPVVLGNPVSDLVGNLALAGATKFIDSNYHSDPTNLRRQVDAMNGLVAAADGMPVHVHVEHLDNNPRHFAQVERDMANPAKQKENAAYVREHITRGQESPDDDAYMRTAVQPGVRYFAANLANPTQRPVSRFKQDDKLALLQTGAMHAEGTLADRDRFWTFPCLGDHQTRGARVNAWPVEAWASRHPPAALWDMHAIHENTQGSVLLRNAKFWEFRAFFDKWPVAPQNQPASAEELRERSNRYYNEHGYAVVEAQVSPTASETLIVPANLLGVVQEVDARYPDDAITIYCDGLPGCDRQGDDKPA